MTTFTIITGIVSLIAFILQIKGLFPRYKKDYSATTLDFLGFTNGLIVASLTRVSLVLPESLSARNILGFLIFGCTGLLIFIFFVASALILDDKRRNDVSKIGSAVSGFFIFLLLFFPSTFFPTPLSANAWILTYDEKIECAISVAKKQDFGRALDMFQNTLTNLPPQDERRSILSKLIDETKRQQSAVVLQKLADTASGLATNASGSR